MKRWILSVMAWAASGAGAAEPVDYLEQVKPLLVERCASCHGALAQRGGLRLDAAQLILRGGDSGRPLVPGQPAASLLIDRITAADAEERMPPEGEPLNAEQVEIGVELPQPPSSGSAVVGDLNVFVPLEGLIDLEAEKSRLKKEIAKFQGLLNGLDKKLSQQSFLEKAPPEVVERERQRQQEYTDNLKKLEASFGVLSS